MAGRVDCRDICDVAEKALYRTMPYHTINDNGNAVLQTILKLVMRKVLILNCLSQTHIYI